MAIYGAQKNRIEKCIILFSLRTFLRTDCGVFATAYTFLWPYSKEISKNQPTATILLKVRLRPGHHGSPGKGSENPAYAENGKHRKGNLEAFQQKQWVDGIQTGIACENRHYKSNNGHARGHSHHSHGRYRRRSDPIKSLVHRPHNRVGVGRRKKGKTEADKRKIRHDYPYRRRRTDKYKDEKTQRIKQHPERCNKAGFDPIRERTGER